jgi:hypothetical protein
MSNILVNQACIVQFVTAFQKNSGFDLKVVYLDHSVPTGQSPDGALGTARVLLHSGVSGSLEV